MKYIYETPRMVDGVNIAHTEENPMIKMLIFLVLSISLALGSVDSFARWHGGGGGWHGGGGGWHHGGGWNGGGWYGDGNDWAGAAVGLAAMAVILNQANYGYYGGQPYYRSYYRHCGWMRGHYDYNGYWIPAHRVCWR